jgi:hypothetical protein
MYILCEKFTFPVLEYYGLGIDFYLSYQLVSRLFWFTSKNICYFSPTSSFTFSVYLQIHILPLVLQFLLFISSERIRERPYEMFSDIFYKHLNTYPTSSRSISFRDRTFACHYKYGLRSLLFRNLAVHHSTTNFMPSMGLLSTKMKRCYIRTCMTQISAWNFLDVKP